MLLEYLKENYEENIPIFISDISLPISEGNLRQMFKTLCDREEIVRYENGIYYFPRKRKLKGGSDLSASEVARYKYILRNNQIIGYYSGYTFANQIGVTTQVPCHIEIVSNQSSAKCREIFMKKQKIILRKPRTEVTQDNCKVLQLLDFVKDAELYMDGDLKNHESLVYEYAKRLCLRRQDIDSYIGLFPDRVYKYIYEMRLYDVFA